MIASPKLISSFIRYKYAFIFPIAIVEGPIITIVAGFLASLGYLNFLLVYIVIVVGDLIGDSIYYFFGRYGRHKVVEKYGHRFGMTPERLKSLENHFKEHSTRELIIGKASHGVGSIFLVTAGISKVPYSKLLSVNFFSTCIKTLILISFGFYFGRTILKYNSYINYIGLGIALFFAVSYFSFYKSKMFRKYIKDLD